MYDTLPSHRILYLISMMKSGDYEAFLRAVFSVLLLPLSYFKIFCAVLRYQIHSICVVPLR